MDPATWANWINVGMVAATAWMGLETRKMAIATRETLELNSQPYLSFEALQFQPAAGLNPPQPPIPALRIGIVLKNPGRVRINFRVSRFVATFAGQGVANPQFQNHGGVLHPGERWTHMYPLILLTHPVAPPQQGEVEFDVNFYATASESHTLHVKVLVRCVTVEGGHEWQFLEGPRYG